MPTFYSGWLEKFLFTDEFKFWIYCRKKGAEEYMKRDWTGERMILQGFKPTVRHGGNVYLYTELTLTKEKYLSYLSETCYTPFNIYGATGRLPKPSILWHHKTFCGRLSNHACRTWVIRFCRHLWSPCQLERLLSLSKRATYQIHFEMYVSFLKIQLITQIVKHILSFLIQEWLYLVL